MSKEQIKAEIRRLPAEDQLDIAAKIIESHRKPLTGKKLLESEIVGMWADRDDIGDSVEFARKLRDEAWGRRTEQRYADDT